MDVLYIYSAAMAPYLLHHPGLRVLDAQDIDSEKWTSYAAQARWPMRLVWAREGRTLLAFERLAASACDSTLFVTEAEARHFMTLAPESAGKIDWLENGVDLAKFDPDHDHDNPYAALPDQGPHLVFTGNMDYWPNADAVIWFAEQAMPALRQRHPGLCFHVVGANPGSRVLRLATLPGVYVTGRVPDVRPYLAHAAVAVAPLRIARGIQNKVLESMAMARPVVASPQAFVGIDAVAGRDLLVAEGAEDTVRCVLEVLDGTHPALASAGRARVEARYGWPAQLARLDGLLTALTPPPDHAPSTTVAEPAA
jgi:sugar transferase (PEP-CTERM/EpsH1 system associated)